MFRISRSGMICRPQLIAIVGGSGSGKSWLAERLRERLGKEADCFSLDNFYLDRSHLEAAERRSINFDHPRSIDWALVERTLALCRAGGDFRLPVYDFKQHSRSPVWEMCKPRQIYIVDGLWLLRRARVRRCFSLTLFLECSESTRLERRLHRDVIERGRTEPSIRDQFFGTVCPMHKRFVEPQRKQADLVIPEPIGPVQVDQLADHIRTFLKLKQTL